ncbi:hypothetical protein SEA_PICARD_31 [Streptomyces phage Picard]|uniref:Uncharacterized protein n=1 Tax=Streptomyces phage Picard TaxID=1920311 RepID=A0A1J0MC15_9CAUD|nr:hypothetical protein HOR45_gp31 [Streptomyces phage Picard]APD18561.1 hypothetical protein SEA_PICARD_31 [Streptomyces phage Picard]
MNTRHLAISSVAVIVLGALLALGGVFAPNFHAYRLGILLALLALAPLGYALLHHATRATEEQLDHAYRAGYHRALTHVSQGLLDAPAAPPDGGEEVGQYDAQGNALCDDDLLDNVRPLRPYENTNPRKAV